MSCVVTVKSYPVCKLRLASDSICNLCITDVQRTDSLYKLEGFGQHFAVKIALILPKGIETCDRPLSLMAMNVNSKVKPCSFVEFSIVYICFVYVLVNHRPDVSEHGVNMPSPCPFSHLSPIVPCPALKIIKKNTNSTPNKSQNQRTSAYKVTSFLSTDCELSTETRSRFLYSLVPRAFIFICFYLLCHIYPGVGGLAEIFSLQSVRDPKTWTDNFAMGQI